MYNETKSIKEETSMKWLLILIAIALVLFVIIRLYAKSGTLQNSFPPGTTSGVTDGQLAPCKTSPNCISSHSEPTDTLHYADPITVPTSITEPKQRIIEILSALPHAVIVEEFDNYIRAEFTTQWIRYVDDVEFLIHKEQARIDFRSASRVGYSDMGLNRKRIEEIRTYFKN